MKKHIITLSFITFIIGVNAQDLEYSYDANGARILRKLIVVKIFSEDTTNSTQLTAEELAVLNKFTEDTNEEENKNESKSLDSYSENIDDVAITIYPNPTVGQLKVAFSDLSEMNQGSIVLYDNAGKQIKSQKINSKTEQIDISNEAKGNYIMLININGVIKEWTVVKM